MYCEKCGQPLGVDARFCSHCGAPVAAVPTTTAAAQEAGAAPAEPLTYATTQAERISDDEPLLVRRPVFVGWVTALSVLPIQIFMTVWAGGFCGGFSTAGLAGLRAVGLRAMLPPWFPFVFFAALAFFGIPGLAYFRKKRSYARTEYRFYPNRLEYYEGFFTIEQKTVLYRNVQEVDLTKGVVQRRYGLGTIVLSTPAAVAGSGRNNWRSGIQVTDIEGPDEVYEQVKRLVREAQSQ